MIANYGIKGETTTTYNPQSNGIIKQVHQTLANSLRTLKLDEQELETHDPWSPFLLAAAFAVQATCHTTMQALPRQIVFGQDMVLPIKYITNLECLCQVQQKQINCDNAHENKNCIKHTYKEGDKVLVDKSQMTPKLDALCVGPYLVNKVWSNGTITLKKDNISKRMNMRYIMPYFNNLSGKLWIGERGEIASKGSHPFSVLSPNNCFRFLNIIYLSLLRRLTLQNPYHLAV